MNEYENRFRVKLRAESLAIYDKLDDELKKLYSVRQCQMCGAHLTIRQINRILHDGVPPICLKDYKAMKGELEKCLPLFDQLSLL